MGGAGGRASSSAAALVAAVSATAAIGSYLVWRRISSPREDTKNAESDTSRAANANAWNADATATAAEDDQDDTFVRDESGIPASIGGGAASAPTATDRDASGNYAAAATESEEHFGRNLRVDLRPVQSPGTITIAYASTTDTCKNMAVQLETYLCKKLGVKSSEDGGSGSGSSGSSSDSSSKVKVQICRVDELDWWDEVLNPDEDDENNSASNSTSLPPPVVLFVLPTWTDGALPPTSQPLLTSLHEISTDWRVSPHPLRNTDHPAQTLHVASFGVGSSAYDPDTFCKPAKDVVELLCDKLGGRRLMGGKSKSKGGGCVGMGDVESGDYREEFRMWMDHAPTPESLEAIDRPLFRDAWDRLRRSLRCLKDKGQRTVARLTVVKGWNSDEVEGYAKLIALGHCSLVEMKGVTFCGKSDASNLNMSNTPWHHEVVDLATQLRDELNRMHEAGGDDAPPRYEFACEHKHSVSVLLARVDQFAYEDPETGERKWKAWIDYGKFQELAAKNAADPTFTFGVEDYTAEAPSWALFGANEEGFDPTDTRHRKKKKHPKYTQFDKDGVPTHDDAGNAIPEEERKKLRAMMDQKIKEVGAGSTVTALTSGEKLISDPSLMFRGKTVVK